MESTKELQDYDDIYTIAELNSLIEDTIETAAELKNVRCLGEISQIDEYDWGVFIGLVYGDHELTALMWGSRYRELTVDLESGMEVLLTGDIEFYSKKGTINLKPWEIEVVGAGERSLRLQQLRAELSERGWFDDEQKRDLPRFPARVGIVTSLDGDARYDIQDAIHSRYPDVELLLADARVQGDHAPESIATAIHTLDREEQVDVIVVGRGGGSETDLEAFNTEPVAEAVFTAGAPVITAVGHREDEPLVYQVADATAITPTEVGPVVVEDREDVAERLETLEDRLTRVYRNSVASQLDGLARRCQVGFEAAFESGLSDLEDRVEDAFATRKRKIERRAMRRKYGAMILVLLLLLLGTVAYIILIL